MRIRIEAQIGPVVLVYDHEGHPQFGESFRVAVFVADKAMGTAKVTNEQFTAFCQAAPIMRSGPCDDYLPNSDNTVSTACRRCGMAYVIHIGRGSP